MDISAQSLIVLIRIFPGMTGLLGYFALIHKIQNSIFSTQRIVRTTPYFPHWIHGHTTIYPILHLLLLMSCHRWPATHISLSCSLSMIFSRSFVCIQSPVFTAVYVCLLRTRRVGRLIFSSGVSRGVFWLPGNPPDPIFFNLPYCQPYRHQLSPGP